MPAEATGRCRQQERHQYEQESEEGASASVIRWVTQTCGTVPPGARMQGSRRQDGGTSPAEGAAGRSARLSDGHLQALHVGGEHGGVDGLQAAVARGPRRRASPPAAERPAVTAL